ncbi:MAG: efflux RND transporter periplasmic adaptor subunit [Burkholderiaceae bacterium]|nr:efflux RND transporter periplasmic adaptor subunit [Burkholderiaceae bacterium]
MKNSRMVVVVTLVIGVALGVAGSRWLAKRDVGTSASQAVATAPVSSTSAAKAAANVQLATVTQVSLPHGVAAVGNLRSENAVELRSEITGRIAQINFDEGGKVAKGQVLVRLDDSVLQAQLQQAQANLNLAASQHRRAAELNKQGFISKQARDEAASQLNVQQAAVALAQAQLSKTAIVAPFDGLAGLRNVSVGDYVSPGSDLVPIESIDPLKADFRIPEQYLGLVRIGTRISLSFDALPGQAREAQVAAISPVIEVGGRSILLRANVPNADGALRPGMFARVQLKFMDTESLVVPETALSPSGQSQYVFRVSQNTAQRVMVSVGQRREGMVEILDGLQAGDQVVISGLQKVLDGGQVQVLPSAAAKADASASAS